MPKKTNTLVNPETQARIGRLNLVSFEKLMMAVGVKILQSA